jgi:pilus assembly protein CpaB
MRAKTILTVLFLISVGVAALVVLHSVSQKGAATETPKDQILVATVPLAAGTFLRAQDVTWHAATPEPDQIVRPNATALAAKPELDEETRASVYGAVLRAAVAVGEPIRHSAIVKPGDRNFLQVVLSPGARAIAIPVTTGGASTGLLSAGDRVDVILTQNFKTENAPLTRRSVSETVVENLRVLAIDAPDMKAAGPGGNSFGRTVSLEVTAQQAEKINVATELGKLSLTLRSIAGPNGLAAATPAGAAKGGSVNPTWAGDVSPALSGAAQEKAVAVQQPLVQVFHGSTKAEAVKPE